MSDVTAPQTGCHLAAPDADRLWFRVNFTGGTPYETDQLATAEGECWLYTGALTEAGYGRFKLDGEWRAAHRIAFLDAGENIPDGFKLDHLCRVHNCLRPSHLEAVTHAVNVARGDKGNVTHCTHGHEYTERNTRRDTAGNRRCRACTHNAYLKRKRQAA